VDPVSDPLLLRKEKLPSQSKINQREYKCTGNEFELQTLKRKQKIIT
jgi:hypothetical protein